MTEGVVRGQVKTNDLVRALFPERPAVSIRCSHCNRLYSVFPCIDIGASPFLGGWSRSVASGGGPDGDVFPLGFGLVDLIVVGVPFSSRLG